MKFMLDGCDISFVAEAPADITLEQLLAQCDKIRPNWCACGIRSLNEDELNIKTEIEISYDSIRKTDKDVSCDIREPDKDWNKAVENVQMLIEMYAQIPTGVFGLMTLNGYLRRYNAGERTDDLYESMMEAE